MVFHINQFEIFSEHYDMKRTIFLFILLLNFCIVSGFSQNSQVRGIVTTPELQVLGQDLELVSHKNEAGEITGIDLYIRKKDSINSVMLCETTKDPEGKQPNYAYRAMEWNKINGDEIRYLNGKKLDSKFGKFSLVSSTPVDHPKLGKAFHIYIPSQIQYGYPWSRNGTITIGKGTFINIRTFEKPYADYNGRSMDNAFMFDFGKPKTKKVKKPVAPPEPVPEPISQPEPEPESEPEPEIQEEPEVILTDDYNPVAAEKFAELADKGNGLMIYSKGPETITEDLTNAVGKIKNGIADIVFCIDTTGSMKDDMETLRKEWVPCLLEQAKTFSDLRIGLLFYRDYNDTYLYKGLPVKVFNFTRNSDVFIKNLNSTVIHGNEGGDIPEAVFEALYSAMAFYDWRAEAEKKIILIGDAEPHPKPRGTRKFTEEYVMNMAKEKNITLDCIIVPDK